MRNAALVATFAVANLLACASEAPPSASDPSLQAGAPSVAKTPAATPEGPVVNNTSGSAPIQVPGPPSAAAGAAPDAAKPSAPSANSPAPAASADALWCGVKKTLDANCIACHNEQKVAGAPMSLKSYADTQAAAVSSPAMKVYQLIGTRVHSATKPMPPQGGLTVDQLSGIDTWIAAQAPTPSDPTCGNAARPAEPTGWQWPTDCDATYKLMIHGTGGNDQPYSVGAGQEIHPQISVAAPWGSETVQMIAWRALTDNARVLHHWILHGPTGEHIVGWSPGKEHSADMPADVGLRLPGGNLILDVHYNNVMGTKAESDHSGLELCVLKKEHFRAKMAATFTGFTSTAISIPAHAANFDVKASCNVSSTQPVTLLTASPHAHKLGTHMKFTVTKSNSQSVVMHDAAFNFEEQAAYPLTPTVEIGSGDKVDTVCTYTNTTDATVTFGQNTENEMCFNFAVYYPADALKCGSAGGLPRSGF